MYGNLGNAEVQRIKQLENENRQLKQLAGDQALAIQIRHEHIYKKGVLISDQREMVEVFKSQIPSERRAATVSRLIGQATDTHRKAKPL